VRGVIGGGEDGKGDLAGGFVQGMDVDDITRCGIYSSATRENEFGEGGNAVGRGPGGVSVVAREC